MEKELQEIYHVMDTNGDGGVTIQEYTVYYGTIGGKPLDAQTSFTAIDNNSKSHEVKVSHIKSQLVTVKHMKSQ